MLRLLGLLFLVLPFYWYYLIFNTQPIVIFDAINYENLGRVLLDQGWPAYFVSLNREPLFPLLISWAMGLERAHSLSYQIYLKIFLFGSLALTMLGTYRLTRLLGAGRVAASMAALYLGISPALVNSTLWLWSEAAACPWGVWIVVVSVSLWRMIGSQKPFASVAICSVLLAGLFFLLTMVKAIAASILVIYLIPFYAGGIYFVFRAQWGRLARVLVCIGIVLGLMGAAVNAYKGMNQRYNGQFELTDRGDFALFGNTVRRLQVMDRERIVQALLSVPRLGLCERYYGNKCVYWTYVTSDRIVEIVRKDLDARGLTEGEKSRFFISNALDLMAAHPFQQGFFMLVESAKMLFWENRLYFVRYPPWLAAIHANMTLVLALCFTWALLSLAGVLYAVFYLVRRIFRPGMNGAEKRWVVWLLTFWFVSCFTGLYALFFIDIRYALPIAPLLVAMCLAWVSHCYVRIRYNVR